MTGTFLWGCVKSILTQLHRKHFKTWQQSSTLYTCLYCYYADAAKKLLIYFQPLNCRWQTKEMPHGHITGLKIKWKGKAAHLTLLVTEGPIPASPPVIETWWKTFRASLPGVIDRGAVSPSLLIDNFRYIANMSIFNNFKISEEEKILFIHRVAWINIRQRVLEARGLYWGNIGGTLSKQRYE